MSDIAKNFRDGTVTFKDGTGTPLEEPLKFEQGSLQVSGLTPGQTETQAYYARGQLISLRKGNFKPWSWSASFTFSEFTEASAGNVLDLIFGTGTDFSARISTTVALGDVMTFDMDIDIEGTDLGDAADHQLALTDITVDDVSWADGDPCTVNLSGTGYGPTPARS